MMLKETIRKIEKTKYIFKCLEGFLQKLKVHSKLCLGQPVFNKKHENKSGKSFTFIDG